MFKYNEDKILEEVKKYIESTYEQHYIGKEGLQIQDVFDMIDISEEFCRGAAIKYLIRFGKKEGKKNPIDDWRENTVWAKKVADEFKS